MKLPFSAIIYTSSRSYDCTSWHAPEQIVPICQLSVAPNAVLPIYYRTFLISCPVSSHKELYWNQVVNCCCVQCFFLKKYPDWWGVHSPVSLSDEKKSRRVSNCDGWLPMTWGFEWLRDSEFTISNPGCYHGIIVVKLSWRPTGGLKISYSKITL